MEGADDNNFKVSTHVAVGVSAPEFLEAPQLRELVTLHKKKIFEKNFFKTLK